MPAYWTYQLVNFGSSGLTQYASIGGTATVIGLIPAGQQVSLDASQFWMAEKRIQGSTLGSNRFRYDLPRLIDLYLQGRLNLDDLISRTYRFDEINEGFALMLAGEVARGVIVFD